MATLDTIKVSNPLDETFECRYNGERYVLQPGEVKHLPQHLARHMAKHLSDILAHNEVEKIKEQKINAGEKFTDTQKTQLKMGDNPIRRICLYKILGSKEEVEEVIKSFPQFKGFVGEIKQYDDFVSSTLVQQEEASEEEEQTTGEPTPVKPTKVSKK